MSRITYILILLQYRVEKTVITSNTELLDCEMILKLGHLRDAVCLCAACLT